MYTYSLLLIFLLDKIMSFIFWSICMRLSSLLTVVAFNYLIKIVFILQKYKTEIGHDNKAK